MSSHAVFPESQSPFFYIKLFFFFAVCEGKRSNNNSKYLLTAKHDGCIKKLGIQGTAGTIFKCIKN